MPTRLRRRVALSLAPLVLMVGGCFRTEPPGWDGTSLLARSTAFEPAAEGSPTWQAEWYYEHSGDPTMAGAVATPMEAATLARGTFHADSTPLPAASGFRFMRVCGRQAMTPPVAFECADIRAGTSRLRSNPLNNLAGDPKVFLADGRLYQVRSFGDIQLLSSTDGATWGNSVRLAELGGPAGAPPTMVPGGPGGQDVNFWAPEVSLVGDTFVMTTSGNHPYPEIAPGYYRGSIFLATSASATGPYSWKPLPVVTDPGRSAIDPSVFHDASTGRTWLTWTDHVDTATGLPPGPGRVWGTENFLWAQELDADFDPVGPRTVILSTDVDPQARERAYAIPGGFQNIIEGQGVFVRDGRYHLYYAAGTERLGHDAAAGEAPYSFNVATSSTFPARFSKAPEPVIEGLDAQPGTTDPDPWSRPGHGSVFVDASGQYWVALHARNQANEPYRRGFLEPLDLSSGSVVSPSGYLSTEARPAIVPCVDGLENDFCSGGSPRAAFR